MIEGDEGTANAFGGPRGRARTGRRYHHGDLKTALIEAAGLALEQGGAEALSFRAVARAANVSQTAPYNHFANRDALLAVLAELGFAELATSQEATSRALGDIQQRIIALGTDYIAFARRRPQLYRLMFGVGLRDWHEQSSVATAKRSSIQPLTSVLGELGMINGWDTDDVDAAARMAWALVHGLAMLRIDHAFTHFGDAARDDLVERQALAVLIRGLT